MSRQVDRGRHSFVYHGYGIVLGLMVLVGCVRPFLAIIPRRCETLSYPGTDGNRGLNTSDERRGVDDYIMLPPLSFQAGRSLVRDGGCEIMVFFLVLFFPRLQYVRDPSA